MNPKIMPYATCVALALSLVLQTGCRTSVNTTENLDKTATVQYIRDARILTDGTLAKRIVTTDINTAESPTGVMKLQVQFMNLSNSEQTIFYTIEWFDGDGMRVETAGGGWTQQQFLPRETLALTFAAPSPFARDFKIKMVENPR